MTMPMAIPISPRTSDWRRKSEDISGKRRGGKGEPKDEGDVPPVAEHLLFVPLQSRVSVMRNWTERWRDDRIFFD